MQIYEMTFPCKYIPLPSILIALKNIIKKNALANGVYTIYNTRFGLKKKKILTTALFSVPHKESGF